MVDRANDDSFYLNMGIKIIEVLQYADMVKSELVRTANDRQVQLLAIADKSLLSKLSDHKIYTIPTKLPMIVKPKPHGVDSEGGYLLNGDMFSEGLIIDKKEFKFKTKFGKDLCDMVNKISTTPFKINTTLLDFITNPINDKYNLLMDSNETHELANVKRTRAQDRNFRSHNSKVVLQENILEIANLFRNFNEIYFPVRLDTRSRLYCTPHYLNYQSSELAKALLLFAKPGIIYKNSLGSITYLKAYGVNCFGGSISKQSIQSKIKWVVLISLTLFNKDFSELSLYLRLFNKISNS